MSAEDRQVQYDALSSFLSSSLNVELVYILLQSITTFNKKNTQNFIENQSGISIAELNLDADPIKLRE